MISYGIFVLRQHWFSQIACCLFGTKSLPEPIANWALGNTFKCNYVWISNLLLKKMHLKMSSAKCQPLYPGFNMLTKSQRRNSAVSSTGCFEIKKMPSYEYRNSHYNKANLRDLIAVTGLVILFKLDSNHRFFSPCDLEIWWMARKIIGHLFYTAPSFVHHLKSISEFKMELQSGNAQLWSKLTIFYPCDLAIWRMTLTNNRAPLLCYFKFCASFRNHWWIQTRVTVRKRLFWVKFDDF